MNLSAEQVAAAEAAGCRFIPVPPDGLHRYAMQRKLFRVAGADVLATRGGGLYETASTLERLILEGRGRLAVAAPEPAAAPDPVRVEPAQPVPAAPAQPQARAPVEATGEEPPAATAESGAAATAADAAAEEPPRRKPRRRRAGTAPEPEPDLPAGAAAEPSAEGAAGPRVRRSAAQPGGARWPTAGAERRGRAGVHWSKRAR